MKCWSVEGVGSGSGPTVGFIKSFKVEIAYFMHFLQAEMVSSAVSARLKNFD